MVFYGNLENAMGPSDWIKKLCLELSGKLWQHILGPLGRIGRKMILRLATAYPG